MQGKQRVQILSRGSYWMPETKSKQFKVKVQIADRNAKTKPYLTLFVNVKLDGPVTTAAPTTKEATPPPTVPVSIIKILRACILPTKS